MHVTQPTPTGVPAKSPAFDKLSFVKYVKDIGRQYRKQAMKLVSICRTFAQAQLQTLSSYDELRSVLQVVDDALYSATEARKKTTKDADAKFKEAIDALSAYEKKYHFRDTVTYTMAEAVAKDKSSSTVLKRLKETFRPLKEEPTKIVEFLLHRSLPDKNPTIVKQVLSQTSDTKEIMWNFSLFKGERRLTLKDNPHFYEKLPTSAEKYEGRFRTDPTETFHHDKISVLTDDPRLAGRVFLETAKEKRAFGNVWVPKEAIIFKDVNGKLEGESIVGKSIQKAPNLWCFEEPPLSNASWTSLSNRSSPSPTMSASPTASPTGSLIEDWREPILRMLRSQDVNIKIRISDKPPANASHSSLPLFSPIPSSVHNSSDDSLLSPKVSQLKRHLNSTTPLESTRPLGAPAPSSPAPPSVPPSRPTSVPISNTALPVSLLPTEPLAALAPLTNAGVPPSGLRVTIDSPSQKLSAKPPTAINVAEVARHVPRQFPDPSFAREPEVATVVPPDPGAPPLDQEQFCAHTASPSPQMKKNWFQIYVWDYKM